MKLIKISYRLCCGSDEDVDDDDDDVNICIFQFRLNKKVVVVYKNNQTPTLLLKFFDFVFFFCLKIGPRLHTSLYSIKDKRCGTCMNRMCCIFIVRKKETSLDFYF